MDATVWICYRLYRIYGGCSKYIVHLAHKELKESNVEPRVEVQKLSKTSTSRLIKFYCGASDLRMFGRLCFGFLCFLMLCCSDVLVFIPHSDFHIPNYNA